MTAVPTTATSPGVVYTRRWIVELILDLAGYVASVDLLGAGRAVDPACGDGEFVIAMAERLLSSCSRHGHDIGGAANAILALDVDAASVARARSRTSEALVAGGVDPGEAGRLARAWIRVGDFLVEASGLPRAAWVVGNPPYVRIEESDPGLMLRYREAWPSMRGRADTYVGFLEAGLAMLEPGGRLAYICPDRWMHNSYGAGIRRVVQRSYAMQACVGLHDVDAFADRVSAYPAIFVLAREPQSAAFVADANAGFDSAAAARLLRAWRAGAGPRRSERAFVASWTEGWHTGAGSWPSANAPSLAKVADWESRLPTLADAGVTIGVGVATGADDVFVTDAVTGVEPSRLVRIVGAKEVSFGEIAWAGRWLVNPWDEKGLVSLCEFPGLAEYLHGSEARLRSRHVAKKSPHAWWRTIDRVNAAVAVTPKLLIPDVKDRVHPVLDQGDYHAMHNLYYAVAPGWDLRVLGGLLMSEPANAIVRTFSVRMANGFMRVSAQYLRRIRLPYFHDIDSAARIALAAAFDARDAAAASEAAAAFYVTG